MSVWFLESAYHIPNLNRQCHSAFHSTCTAWLTSVTVPRSSHLSSLDFLWIIIEVQRYVTEGFFQLVLHLRKRLLLGCISIVTSPSNISAHFPLSGYFKTKYQLSKAITFRTQSTVWGREWTFCSLMVRTCALLYPSFVLLQMPHSPHTRTSKSRMQS